MTSYRSFLALDVGEKRIGIATADATVCIAVARNTIDVDGGELTAIKKIIASDGIDAIIVGYPRNQAGEATKQTEYVERFAKTLEQFSLPVMFQDESLTSVKAEELLKRQQKPYQKKDIDAVAASLILQDYLEVHHGRI